MLHRAGIQRMTVPGVAPAAGVAKTTVYRRYATPIAARARGDPHD